MSGEIRKATVGLFFVSVKVDGQDARGEGVWVMGSVGDEEKELIIISLKLFR
jgi:hypothetical protein